MNQNFIPGKEIIERVNKYVRFAAKRFARYDWEVWMDKLHWDKVHEMIERIFYYSVVSINIRDGK